MNIELLRTIEESRKRMECLVNFNERSGETDPSPNRRIQFKRRARANRGYLETFLALTEAPLSPLFRLCAEPYAQAGRSYNRHTKNQFRHSRAAIFKSIAVEQPGRLQEMGLSLKEVEFMARTGERPRRNDRELDMTIDHIVPLARGGTNRKKNMRLIPRYLNNFLDWFTQIQAPDGDTTHVVTLHVVREAFIDYPYVPILPGGFRERYGTRRALKERTEELLGVEVAL